MRLRIWIRVRNFFNKIRIQLWIPSYNINQIGTINNAYFLKVRSGNGQKRIRIRNPGHKANNIIIIVINHSFFKHYFFMKNIGFCPFLVYTHKQTNKTFFNLKLFCWNFKYYKIYIHIFLWFSWTFLCSLRIFVKYYILLIHVVQVYHCESIRVCEVGSSDFLKTSDLSKPEAWPTRTL